MWEYHAVPEMKRDQQSPTIRAGAGSHQLTNSILYGFSEHVVIGSYTLWRRLKAELVVAKSKGWQRHRDVLQRQQMHTGSGYTLNLGVTTSAGESPSFGTELKSAPFPRARTYTHQGRDVLQHTDWMSTWHNAVSSTCMLQPIHNEADWEVFLSERSTGTVTCNKN